MSYVLLFDFMCSVGYVKFVSYVIFTVVVCSQDFKHIHCNANMYYYCSLIQCAYSRNVIDLSGLNQLYHIMHITTKYFVFTSIFQN